MCSATYDRIKNEWFSRYVGKNNFYRKFQGKTTAPGETLPLA